MSSFTQTTDGKSSPKSANTSEYLSARSAQSQSATEKTEQTDSEKIITNQGNVITLNDVAHVFVHEKYPHIALQNIRDAAFHETIHNNLKKKKFTTIFRTQAHSWPLILHGTSTIVVNSDRSGKTYSYLPAILSSILYASPTMEPIAPGPIGIIIVSSSREVELLFTQCRDLVTHDKMSIVKAFGKLDVNEKLVRLLNGCDLLITTPSCFSRLSQSEVYLPFDKKRIKHLVIDGLDKISGFFDKEIQLIMKICTRGDKHPEDNPQVVITSSSWNEYIRHYMKLVCDPVVLIGSFVEAALYAKCRFTLKKISFEQKLDMLIELLETRQYKSKRTVIAFSRQAEIAFLANFFSDRNIKIAVLDNKVKYTEFIEIKDNLMTERIGRLSIVLVSDEALSNCKFKDGEVLIHFSLPDMWTKFSKRFTTLTNCFLSVAKENRSELPTTTVLLDDENFVEIPHLIDFLKARKILSSVPKDIEDLVQVKRS